MKVKSDKWWRDRMVKASRNMDKEYKKIEERQEEIEALLSQRAPYIPNEIQATVRASKTENTLFLAGRSGGKSSSALQWLSDFDGPGVQSAWVDTDGPAIVRYLLPEVKTRFPEVKDHNEKGKALALHWPKGMTTWCLSAEKITDATSLRGIKNLKAAVMNEASFFHAMVFGIFAACCDYDCRYMYATTKQAGGEIQRLAMQVAPQFPDRYAVIECDSYAGRPPHISVEDWDYMIEGWRQKMTAAQFDREVLNHWGSADGAVFMHVTEAFERGRENLPPFPPAGAQLAGLVDWAESPDWTVVGLLGRIARDKLALWIIDRFQGLEYDNAAARVAQAFQNCGGKDCSRQPTVPIVYADAGHAGGAANSLLRKLGYEVQDVLFGSSGGNFRTLKDLLVYELSLLWERDQMDVAPTQFAPIAESETLAFASKPTETGRWTYNAPSGQHDDCVSVELMVPLAMRSRFVSPHVVADAGKVEFLTQADEITTGF